MPAHLPKRLLVSFVTLGLLIGVAEGVCRLLPSTDAGGTRAGFVVEDPHLLWKLVPVAKGPLATNELGLRDSPYRADAEQKILLLGDSVAWGDGIQNPRDCFPFLLEQHLQEADPGHTTEVINAAVPGYSTFQQKTWLERHGLALEPDLVLLQFCLNDITARYNVLASYGGDDTFLGIDTRSAIPGLHGFLVRNSRAYQRLLRMAQDRARESEAYDVHKLAEREWSAEIESAFALTLSEIDEIALLCRSHDIPFALLIVPYRFQLPRPKRLGHVQARLLEFARERDYPAIDLLPALAADKRARLVFRDPSHFSEIGHAAAARLLTPFVLELLARTSK